jgi:hypothetical protein
MFGKGGGTRVEGGGGLEVEAGGEHAPLGPEHDGVDLGVAIERTEHATDFFKELGGHRVQLLGPCQHHLSHTFAGLVDPQACVLRVVAHNVLLARHAVAEFVKLFLFSFFFFFLHEGKAARKWKTASCKRAVNIKTK